MKMTKKFLLLLLSMLVGTGLVCAGGQQEGASADKVTIRVLSYHHSGAHDYPLYTSYIERFEKENPQAVIEHEGLENNDARTKLAVEMAAGTPPDISFMVQGLAREYSEQGLLMDLAPHILNDPEWKSMYYESALNNLTWDGEIYLVPAHAHYGGMFYNPAVLKEVGFDGPAQTWDELNSQAEALKAVGKSAFITNGKQFRYAWLISQIMVRTIGVDKMNRLYRGDLKTSWDDPDAGFIAALERLDELVKAGGFPRDVNGLDGPVANIMWGDGQGAYWYEGTWHVNGFKANVSEEFRDSLKWSTFPSIAGAGGDQNGGVGGPLLGWGVSSKVDDPAKNELMLKYVKGVEDRTMASRHISENSQPTGTKPFPEAMQDLHPLLISILEGYEDIDKVAYPTDVAAPSPVDNAIKKIAVPSVIAGAMTPVEAAQEVNARAKEYWK